jgi:hypothetical protein
MAWKITGLQFYMFSGFAILQLLLITFYEVILISREYDKTSRRARPTILTVKGIDSEPFPLDIPLGLMSV